MSPSSRSSTICDQFPTHWQTSTADNNLTLHGFRRFKTTHLLNLRYLEAEIAELDRTIYQLGLHESVGPYNGNRLGLEHGKRDEKTPSIEDDLTETQILKLRGLLKEYDNAIMAFNFIMSMETVSLFDDENQVAHRQDLTIHELYKTRLVRVDQSPRVRQDPLQRRIHKILRWFRFWRLSKKSRNNVEAAGKQAIGEGKRSYQNTALVSTIISRSILVILTAIFLTVPLISLSQESRKGVQLTVISTCVAAFGLLVSLALAATSLEIMIVCAAYAAILAVFLSNGSG